MKTPIRTVCLLLLAGTVGACEQELSTPIADEELQTMDANLAVFGMASFITSEGVREARIEADTAYIYEDTGIANLHRMRIVFYDELGRERATVTGASGEWNQETDRMVARGDVNLLVHSDSSTIESQEIFYDPQLDRVWSDSTSVRTTSEGTVTSGSAFESDMSFENIRIENARGGARRIF